MIYFQAGQNRSARSEWALERLHPTQTAMSDQGVTPILC